MSLPAARRIVFLGAFALSLLAGCAGRTSAPVVERGVPARPVAAAPAPPTAAPDGFHTVKKGDTLYSIALEYGHSPRDVADWNRLENPASIKIGQLLRVTPPESAAEVKPIAGPAAVEARPIGATSPGVNTGSRKHEPKGGKQPYSEQALAALQKSEEPPRETPVAPPRPETKPAEPAAAGDDLDWGWPSGGKVIATFSDAGGKGIDIGGKIGDPVLAAEAGKVTYAGSGIRGYGNLLIIQHQNGLSSVYAHNSRLLAKEGQMVARGQKIAEVGNSDADQAKLHFEIRRQGKPLDPLRHLPAR